MYICIHRERDRESKRERERERERERGWGGGWGNKLSNVCCRDNMPVLSWNSWSSNIIQLSLVISNIKGPEVLYLYIFVFFRESKAWHLTFHVNHLHSRQFTWSAILFYLKIQQQQKKNKQKTQKKLNTSSYMSSAIMLLSAVNIHDIPHTVRQNLTECLPLWTPFPIRFLYLTEFSYHFICYFLKS